MNLCNIKNEIVQKLKSKLQPKLEVPAKECSYFDSASLRQEAFEAGEKGVQCFLEMKLKEHLFTVYNINGTDIYVTPLYKESLLLDAILAEVVEEIE